MADKMTISEFTDKVDGIVNDFTTGLTDGKEFRGALLDLLLEVAKPKLSNPGIPPLETIAYGRNLCLTCSCDIDDCRRRFFKATGREIPKEGPWQCTRYRPNT